MFRASQNQYAIFSTMKFCKYKKKARSSFFFQLFSYFLKKCLNRNKSNFFVTKDNKNLFLYSCILVFVLWFDTKHRNKKSIYKKARFRI